MRTLRVWVIVSLVFLVAAALADAQDDTMSVSGTFSGNVQALPKASSSFTLNLTAGFADLTATSSTYFTVFPAIVGSQLFIFEYDWTPITLDSQLIFGLAPFGFQSWNAYASADLFNATIGTDSDAPSLLCNLSVAAVILPSFTATATLYLNAQIGPFASTSESILDLYPISFQMQHFTLEVKAVYVTLGAAGITSFNAHLGSEIDLLPSFATVLWLDLSLTLGDLTLDSNSNFEIVPGNTRTQLFTLTYSLDSATLTSKTTFGLSPFEFVSQYLRLDVAVNPFSTYVWMMLANHKPSMGAGFSYAF